MLDDFKLLELLLQKVDSSISLALNELPPNELGSVNFVSSLKLVMELGANTLCWNLGNQFLSILTLLIPQELLTGLEIKFNFWYAACLH